jgi:PAT family beta-lactamase induction signal transducer AmpG
MPSFAQVLFSRRMLVSFLMGFSCGLPLLLTGSVLQAWMKTEGVDLSLIGLTALVGLPYSYKFIWSPFMDRYTPPFLGRRRGWLLIAQVFLALALVFLGFSQPAQNLWLMAGAAVAVAFFSASQDIVVDAYRREDLSEGELGLGSSLYVNGYRVGMLLASGGGLILADHIPFRMVYMILAGCMGVGVLTTFWTPEPPVTQGAPKDFKEAVLVPFLDYFRRRGAYWVLAFILLYKIGDQMASAMTTPFYLDLGFTKTDIGAIVKLFGFWAILIGGFVGGALILRFGIYGSLWIFGVFQAVSTAGFALLGVVGASKAVLAGVIAFENFTGGMGTSAFVAFMATLTNKRFTATQYALLTSFMALPRTVLSAPTGYMVKEMGWIPFFIFCTVIAVPGMLLLLKFSPEEVRGEKGPA